VGAMVVAHRQVLALLIINNNGHMAAGARHLALSNKSLPPDNTELPSAGGRVDQGYAHTQYLQTKRIYIIAMEVLKKWSHNHPAFVNAQLVRNVGMHRCMILIL